LKSYFGLQADQWQHIVAGYDGSSFFIYVNGENKTLTTSSASSIGFELGNFAIGTRQTTGAEYYGLIDELRIYDRVLTQDEINQLYALQTCSDQGGTECGEDYYCSGNIISASDTDSWYACLVLIMMEMAGMQQPNATTMELLTVMTITIPFILLHLIFVEMALMRIVRVVMLLANKSVVLLVIVIMFQQQEQIVHILLAEYSAIHGEQYTMLMLMQIAVM